MNKKLEPVQLKGLERVGQPKAEPSDKKQEELDFRSPSELWMEANPEFKEEAPTDPVETPATTEAEPLPAAAEATPEETATPEVKAETVETKPAEVKAAEKTEAAPAEPKAAEVKTPEPQSFSAEEKFALADGNEWTRAQIIEGLQRFESARPLISEAEGFRALFKSDLQRLRRTGARCLIVSREISKRRASSITI